MPKYITNQGESYMVLITKQEMEYLKEHGARWEKELHRTYSKHHKYYLTEVPRYLVMLDEYRKDHTLFTSER